MHIYLLPISNEISTCNSLKFIRACAFRNVYDTNEPKNVSPAVNETIADQRRGVFARGVVCMCE